jgi:hypothetical protein
VPSWVDVRILEDGFDEDDAGLGHAMQRFYAEADGFVTADVAAVAGFGGVAVPARGASYSATRPRCVRTTLGVKRINYKKFEITANFAEPSFGPGATIENLLALPARISRKSEHIMEEYTRDFDDPPKAVVTPAGEPFDPGPQRLTRVKVYTVKKYVTLEQVAAIDGAELTNNAEPINLKGRQRAVDTLFMEELELDEVPGFANIFEATMTIKYKPGKWRDPVLAMGLSELVAGRRQPIMEWEVDPDTGAGKWVAVAKPWPLNENGTKKATPDADPDTLVFWPYPQSSWNGVPLT